jgi:hypothetical protein
MSILKALEEFLRDIAEQQAGQRGGRPPPARPVRAMPPREPVVEAEVLEAVPLREAVSQHVAQHLDPSSIRRHTAQLGAELAQEEAKHQSELREKFGHKLGRLSSTKPATAGAPAASQVTNLAVPTRAGDLAQLLRSPASIRQAILLNEILARPEHRW